MSDAVTVRKNGFAEMAYVGAKPWHGLGQALEPGAAIETWQRAAGMDWQIHRTPVCFATHDDEVEVMAGRDVLYRSDTREGLGVVSTRYQIVQPGEVLEFFRDLVTDNGYELTTAGTLFGGSRFWALASIGEEETIVGNDRVGGYLLLSTSCDGSLTTSARRTTVRVVCNNTLTMALQAIDQPECRVSHATTFQPAAVKAELGLARDAFHDFTAAARDLAKVRLTQKSADEFLETLLTDTRTVTAKTVPNTAPFRAIRQLYDGAGQGAQLAGSKGTAWGLVNAVTEYVDHHAAAKNDSNRLANAWFGRGEKLKTEALQRTLELV